MAQFYMNAHGNRGELTCMGTKDSGIVVHVRGWNIGAKIYISYDMDNDRDIVSVYRTSGSNGRKSDKLVAFYSDKRVKAHKA